MTNVRKSLLFREPLVGFEPTTARLRIESSTPELQWRTSDEGRTAGAPLTVCPGADSNRDAFRHYPLKIACLPVSPPGRAGGKLAPGNRGVNPIASVRTGRWPPRTDCRLSGCR